MRRAAAYMIFGLLLAGCGVSQSRGEYPESVNNGTVNRETALHGSSGVEIATIFESSKFKDKRRDFNGQARGLSVSEFWTVEVAENPDKPTKLTQVGFFHKLEEEEGDNFIYEFFSEGWVRIAYLLPSGDLFDFRGKSENNLGKFQLENAIKKLYPAPSGYGYDPYLQDRMSIKHHDVEVSSLDSAGRGVKHTEHADRPPIWVYKSLKTGEVIDTAEKYRRARAYEGYAEIAKRLKDKKIGDLEDGEYGGIEFKDGHPVDENGKKLRPGSR